MQIQNGTLSLTEGALGATEMQMTGLFIINARDLNEAIRLASHMPQAQSGAIEVRALIEMTRKHCLMAHLAGLGS